MSKKVIGYTRVSSASQAEDGCSLAAQAEQIRAYAKLYGLTLVEVFVDAGRSGKDMNREGLKKALEALSGDDVSGLIISKLDRLSRSMRDLMWLIDERFQNKDLISVSEKLDTSTPMGRFALNIIGSVSELERHQISQRTKVALQHLKAQGKRVGGRGAPYGKSVSSNGKLKNNSKELSVIRQARRLRASGLSFAKVAKQLADKGIFARNGKVFHTEQIRKMMD